MGKIEHRDGAGYWLLSKNKKKRMKRDRDTDINA